MSRPPISQEKLDIILSSEEPTIVVARQIGVTTRCVRRYKQKFNYHPVKKKVIKKDVKAAEKSFLY